MQKRLETMVATNDGFKIAEVDLELRGSGELFGMRQAGEANFMMLDVVHDTELLILREKILRQLFKAIQIF